MNMTKYIYPYRVSVVREKTDRYPRISNSKELQAITRELLADAATERFLVFFMDSKNRITGFNESSVGSLNVSVVHPRDTMRAAVIQGASAIVLAHNHPSGDPTPSREDRECTKRLCHAGRILGIRVLDHIVVGESDYYSFADAGTLGDFDDPEVNIALGKAS